MNERAEYFAILTALVAKGEHQSVADLIDAAYRIWYAADQCCRDAKLGSGGRLK